MMTWWLYALQQFQFSIIHRPGGDDTPVELFWTYEFSRVQGFLVDLASDGVPEEI